jgi:peptidoglycan/LPS O-acetylase OafA/YrhL
MNSQATPTRRYAIDWIRVFAILTVFIFHSTRFFDSDDWHVKNANT